MYKEVHPPSSSEDDFMDKPIKFSTSGAKDHRAFDTFFPPPRNTPWYQSHVVTGSIAVFMIYFCMIREENDIDEELGKSLWQRIPPLREQSLQHEIRAGKLAGTDVSELEKELDELYKKYK